MAGVIDPKQQVFLGADHLAAQAKEKSAAVEAFKLAEEKLRAASAPYAKSFKIAPDEFKAFGVAKNEYIAARAASLKAHGQPAESEAAVQAVVDWNKSEGIKAAKPAAQAPDAGAGRGHINSPAAKPTAATPVWHAVKRGDTLTDIVDQGPGGDPHMAQLRVQVRQALGGKATDHDIVAVAAITLARGSHIENINKISTNDKILAMTKEEIQKAVEDLKGAGKIDGKGHLALGKDEVTLAQIFAPKTPAVAKPSAGAAPAK